jgi:hypothetical protein
MVSVAALTIEHWLLLCRKMLLSPANVAQQICSPN